MPEQSPQSTTSVYAEEPTETVVVPPVKLTSLVGVEAKNSVKTQTYTEKRNIVRDRCRFSWGAVVVGVALADQNTVFSDARDDVSAIKTARW